MIPKILLEALQLPINGYIHLDPETSKRLNLYHDKIIKIELKPFGLIVFMQIQAGGIQLLDEYAKEVDASIKGTIPALAAMAYTQAQGKTQISKEVEISGDIDLVQNVSAAIRQIEIDWEEYLTKVTGDVVAHQIGNRLRDFHNWGKACVTILQENTSEYVQEEVRWLPPRAEIHDFYTDVNHLRNDVERLEARLARLQDSLDAPRGVEKI